MYYVGMMSGTSLDGIDAVLLAYQDDKYRALAQAQTGFSAQLRQSLYQLNFPHSDNHQRGVKRSIKCDGELHTAKVAEYQLTECYAKTYQKLIDHSGINPKKIQAIGAHGQTIRHQPNHDYPYTIQLLNGALLSYLTQQTVVCDFRSKDLAAGGQGAPLAPIFHQYLFTQTAPFAVVNIGGIANISLIDDRFSPTLLSGFDCGPGNCLMDEWIATHRHCTFDKDGQWAASGELLPSLLSQWLSDDYFALPAPKSTGRDYFNSAWLTRFLTGTEAPNAVMRTLLTLTAQAIADNLPDNLQSVILAGGGAKNPLLCQTIKECLQTRQLQRGVTLPHVDCADNVGIDAQWVEAAGFALLAQRCLLGQKIDTQTITGAKQPIVCGAIYR